MPKKILRILNRFNVGGPTYNAVYLTKYLSSNYETKLIGGEKDKSEASSLYMADNLDLDYQIISGLCRSLNPIKDYQAYKKIKEIIRQYKPDIVHTHASKAGTIGRLAAISCNVPVIVHTFHGHIFHGYFNPIKTLIFKYIERYLAKHSNSIIAISEIQKKELVEKHRISDNEKVSVVPLGFDLDRFSENTTEKRLFFRKKYGFNDDELVIGIIGRLVPIKNHQLFIKAAKYAKENTNQKLRFVVIGDGESKQEIQELCTQLNLTYTESDKKSDVTFTSWIKEIDIALAGIDIVCLTSLNEGTPVSLIEAQAAGKPIVSTEVGGIRNVVIPNKSALLSNIKNEELFCTNLITLINDKMIYKSMSNTYIQEINKKFSYQTLTNNMERLYQSISG